MTVLKWMRRLGVVALIVIGVGIGWGYLRIRELEKHVFLTQSDWDGRVARFLEDQRLVSQIPWFRGGPARVVVPPDIVSSAAKDQGPESVLGKVAGAHTAGDSDSAVLADLAWMDRLSKFDYWPSEGKSPDWIKWGKLRYRRTAKGTKALQALREVRELARLAGTTEKWVDAMAMLALLRLESEFYASLLAGNQAPKDFSPFDGETLDRARRALGTVADFFHYRWPPSIIAAVFGDPSHRVGLCAAIEEGLVVALMQRPFLESAYPDRYRILDQVLSQTEGLCRLPEQREAWADRSNPPVALRGGLSRLVASESGHKFEPVSPELALSWGRFSRVPLLKQIYGLQLAEMAQPEPALAKYYR